MIHYTCDRCKREIDPEQELRYVVKLEIQAAMEPLDCDEIEGDRDHLMEIQEILEQLIDDDDAVAADVYQKQRFDLCPDCHRRYIQNPLGHELTPQFGFSNN